MFHNKLSSKVTSSVQLSTVTFALSGPMTTVIGQMSVSYGRWSHLKIIQFEVNGYFPVPFSMSSSLAFIYTNQYHKIR